MSKKWFKAKTYGYGWYPATWQGWLCILGYVVVLTASSWLLEANLAINLVPFILIVFLSTGLLIYVCYKKGEPASWRWGEDDKK
ncbi:MAG: hypothetical protein BWY19_00665 [bacterium ADurb.Bin212]|nr:MAG: hypothetical protein BWY19_00665 [bacterium ADurb.Bin212]